MLALTRFRASSPSPPRRESLLDLFAGLEQHAETFLIWDEGFRQSARSYREVSAAARSFAARLQAAGIGKGDRVAIWSENRPEWIAAFWGCLLAGAVVVPIDFRASAALAARICQVAEARLLLAGDEVAPASGVEVLPLSGLRWEEGGQPEPVEASRDDIAEILFTSGATGEPKGVIITHGNILANVAPIEREILKYRHWSLPFRPLRFLNLLPLSHMFGQAMATFIPPLLPGTVIFLSGFNPRDITRLIRSKRVSVLVCVPRILEVLRQFVAARFPEAAHPPAEEAGVLARWWRYRRVHQYFGWKFWALITGAAPLDPALEEYWSRLGFLVIQGYGLTETAPIVTLNHPFHARRGTVGKPIAGVEVKIAPDGEILVRGENVTRGYLGESEAGAFEDGWLHTGDIGELDEQGNLHIRGRKKEMIITPEGLNVFPEDVERVLRGLPGVRDCAVVGARREGSAGEQVHAVLVVDPGVSPEEIVSAVNQQLEEHQKIRSYSLWPEARLPRTSGTEKLKRSEIRQWVEGGRRSDEALPSSADSVEEILRRFAAGRALSPETTMDALGLSSLERIELAIVLERTLGAPVPEDLLAGETRLADLKKVVQEAPRVSEPFEFPRWNRSAVARAFRRVNLPLWILPLARVFVHVRVRGLEHLDRVKGPVIFAPNHQSHLDVPALLLALPARWRYRVAPAMSKEFFDAHFHPERHSRREWFTNSLNYYLACLIFNAFPLPQREAGTKQTLQYAAELAAEGWSIVIFPEGRISSTGELGKFQAGVAMLAARLGLPVVPVRLRGLNRILLRGARMARPGRAEVIFGPPLEITDADYGSGAEQVEAAVRALE